MKMSFRGRIFVGLLPLWAAALPAAAGLEAPSGPLQKGFVRVLAVEQEARGLPDQEPDQPLFQKMQIDNRSRRLILNLYRNPSKPPEPAPSSRVVERKIILHMNTDPPEIIEIWDGDRTFRRTSRDLNQIQEERDRHEAMILHHLNDLSAAEQKATLEENFLRRDGKRIVDVVVNDKERRKILGLDCQEVKVFENGRNVIHAWITRDIPDAQSYYNLYRRLGAFSEQVLARVAELKGLPLEAEIIVVTAAPAYRISARCISLKYEDIPETDFDIPAGYKEKKDDLPPIVPCAWCGKDVERKEPGGRVITPDGKNHYFCSRDCQRKWNNKRREEKMKRMKKAGEKG